MIRSSIGIVCVLVLLTTCAPSTAAQACGEYSLSALRSRALQSQLSFRIELAERGISDRILSSDAYHDKFRFRAAPVKQSPNWKMPIVDVRPAKNISIAHDPPRVAQSPTSKAKFLLGTKRVPQLNWVWESSSNLAVRYCELDDPADTISLDFIPRPFPTEVGRTRVIDRTGVKLENAKFVKIELIKVARDKQKSAKRNRSIATGRKDYWDYYGDCDRWDVVFAIPEAPSKLKSIQQVADAGAAGQQKSQLSLALRNLTGIIADRWGNAISFYRTVSKRFLTSR